MGNIGEQKEYREYEDPLAAPSVAEPEIMPETAPELAPA